MIGPFRDVGAVQRRSGNRGCTAAAMTEPSDCLFSCGIGSFRSAPRAEMDGGSGARVEVKRGDATGHGVLSSGASTVAGGVSSPRDDITVGTAWHRGRDLDALDVVTDVHGDDA